MWYKDSPEYRYLVEHDADDRERIRTYLRQATVPSAGTGGPEGARMVADLLRGAGFQEVEFVGGDAFPGVWGCLNESADKTLVVYGMYDTKPPNVAAWPVPPYDAAMAHLDGLGNAVLGPGAKGRKAPFVQFINAVRALRAVGGRCPVNLVVLAEGEENNGSPEYARFIDHYRDRLQGAVGCFAPGACQSPDGNATVSLGHKGLIYLRLTASGKRMGVGPQEASAHGMSQVLVDSPAWHLMGALNALYDQTTRTIKVDGVQAQIAAASPAERREVEQLLAGLGKADWHAFLGGLGDSRTRFDELSALEATVKYFYEPGFNINGLAAGYTGPGSPVFTLPSRAVAMLDIRMPRGASSAKTLEAIHRTLTNAGYGDVEAEALALHEPAKTDRDAAFVRTWESVFARTGHRVTFWPYSGGGGPWSGFTSEFGMPVLFDAGIGHGGRAGGPGEYLVLDSETGAAGNVETEVFYAEFLRSLK